MRIDPETEAIATIGSPFRSRDREPGDMALVPNPTYPIHTYSMIIAGANVRSVPPTAVAISSNASKRRTA